MAGSDQSKRSSKQNDRVDPKLAQSSSRVSNVVGSVGSQSARNNQQANKQGSRRQEQSTPKRAQGKKQRAKKSPSPNANRPAKVSSPSPNGTADSRAIAKVRDAFGNMPPHHQQRLLGIILLLLALFLLAALTVFHSIPFFSVFHGAFTALFGWSAYLFSIGLIAFAVAHLIEGIRNTKIIRLWTVIGLVVLWLLLLVESQLLLGGTTGGFLGALLVRPLLGWPPLAGHVLLIGLFAIFTIVTFQITLGHVMYIARAFRGIATSGPKSASSSNGRTGPSPFLGQRPRFSRYGSGSSNSPSTPANVQQGSTPPDAEDEEEDDQSIIEFEADFGDDDDPLNDINIHKQQISRVPRGPRPALSALPPNPAPHNDVVQGVNQQALPFNQAVAGKNAEKKYPTMEPLAPNPLQKNKVHNQAEAALIGSPWKLPDTTILNNPEEVKLQMLGDDTSTLAKTIQDTLRSFRVEAEVKQEDISIGPTVIRFGIRPTGKPELKQDAQGKYVPVRDAGGNIVYEARTRVSRIMALQNDLALVLEAKSIRMEAPVPGRPYVGVEIPNKNSRLVTLREVLETKEYHTAKTKSKLAIALGKDVAGAVRIGDLSRMPHLLIAGATGSGKSVCINTIIASILTQATPDDVRLLMVDPKMVELNMYSGIPHLLLPVVTEVEKVVSLLKNAISEMEKRYRLFSQLGVRNLDGYRKLRFEKIARGDTTMKNLPAIVVIIDELADLMMAAPEEIEGMICRLAQLARATGIHLVVATQRPSVDVITGLIKANIPTRISFMVSSMVDSRTIIDMGGAERLLGRGDMLYLPADAGRPERIQGSFVADDEAEKLIAYWRLQAMEHINAAHNSSNQNPAAFPQPIEPGWEIKEHVSDDFELEDDLLERAEEVVREYERASISLLQRRLRIGYSRAARLIDLLEERGIIGQPESGGRSREVFEGSNGSERRG
ncbi:MAG TPA: DNA translocase FtsK, partial [Ktedonobacteraceae bacterium]|nr:DNA translocase FtsK [Ktedonobacteraceae bacterium]